MPRNATIPRETVTTWQRDNFRRKSDNAGTRSSNISGTRIDCEVIRPLRVPLLPSGPPHNILAIVLVPPPYNGRLDFAGAGLMMVCCIGPRDKMRLKLQAGSERVAAGKRTSREIGGNLQVRMRLELQAGSERVAAGKRTSRENGKRATQLYHHPERSSPRVGLCPAHPTQSCVNGNEGTQGLRMRRKKEWERGGTLGGRGHITIVERGMNAYERNITDGKRGVKARRRSREL
ncbi:hypothetical protein C8F04DRAFT_1190458 [Mycena alexandri]|uniref:Uncharacterized protein n=1 Tax=Mycena alexandri TaxID=1745969 RepID=A0AAD6WV95_9AGAR|nr:hypothetical protein C8F04DRAFT_1190458 [Mycena alexandri]